MNRSWHYDPLSSPLFPNVHWGKYLSRPNRFIVECRLNGRVVRAHLPNPGRLWELLIPGRAIGLVKHRHTTVRETLFTAVAIEREGQIIVLHTHKANVIVQALIEQGKIRGLEGAKVIQTEVRRGNSRFDMLVQKDRETMLLEVKSCTLFGKDIAMFPDAVTERGRRHILELAAHAEGGMKCGVVFLVHTSQARFFLPDFHTDYAFARTFMDMKDRICYRAIAIQWDRRLNISPDVRELVIPWKTLSEEASDRGNYLLIRHILEGPAEKDGDLNQSALREGYYIQVQEAGHDLSGQMMRHLRHIKGQGKGPDPLGIRIITDFCTALPIRSAHSITRMLHGMLERISEWSVTIPAPSDASQPVRLFGMKANPLHSPSFIDLLQYVRMDRLKMT